MRASNPLPLAAGPLALVLIWGCAATGSGGWWPSSQDQAGDSLSSGIEALESGDYPAATGRFRELASRCDSGAHGRRALLLLATTALDPRNPDASPDEGARMAAHFLGLPGADTDQRLMAETLFLLALDRGAAVPAATEAADTSGSEAGSVAPRFHDCSGEGGAEVTVSDRTLPELPGPPVSVLLSRLRTQRDSLAAEVTALDAELERIRALLQDGVRPDTFERNR